MSAAVAASKDENADRIFRVSHLSHRRVVVGEAAVAAGEEAAAAGERNWRTGPQQRQLQGSRTTCWQQINTTDWKR